MKETYLITYPWGLSCQIEVWAGDDAVMYCLRWFGKLGIVPYDDLKPHPDQFCKDCAEIFIELHPESKALIEAVKIRRESA